jgi:hypothetical protein
LGLKQGRKRYLYVFVLLSLVLCLICCAGVSHKKDLNYGILISAVTFSADKVIGEYGDVIPDDFDKNKFLEVVKDKIPQEYFHELTNDDFDVYPKGSYYLLIAYNDKSIILFDYSCTPEADGPVLNEPSKYDVDNLDQYDQCKESITN